MAIGTVAQTDDGALTVPRLFDAGKKPLAFALADMTGDGVVDFADLPTFQSLFFQPPGPSGLVP